jgi:hypothetical protein
MAAPPQVCAACFNKQQLYAFPFIVYCEHQRTLAVVHSKIEYAAFDCAPEQVAVIMQQLKSRHPGLRTGARRPDSSRGDR